MIEFSPKVSIVIPVYNGSDYLAEAIECALKQSYSNCEVLVINDGSADEGKSAAIAKSFGGRISYFEKQNGGVATALNLGISKSTGQYLSWLSHDDLYPVDKVKIQVEALQKIAPEDRDRAVVYGDWREIDQNGNYLGRGNIKDKHPEWKLNDPLYPLVNGLLHGCSLLVPLDLLRAHGGFRAEFRTTQDYDCWSRILPAARVVFVPKILVHSRIHPHQTSRVDSSHAHESRELWSRIINSVSVEDMRKLEGSPEAFRIKMSGFLNSLESREAQPNEGTSRWRAFVVGTMKALGFARVRTWFLKLVDS